MKRILAAIIFLVAVQFLFAQTPPVAVNDTFTINKNNSVFFFVLANDYDIDGDPLFITILTAPSHGTATVNGNNINYIPTQNYSGTDSFVYLICDTTNRCDTGTVYITITANNNPPVANNDNYTILQNTTITLPALSNDYDADGDPLTVTVLTPPANGTVTVNGTDFTYVPANNYTGLDSFLYVVCDNSNLCDTATVYINITGNNTAPVASNDDFAFGDTLNTATLDLLSNDSDADGDSIFVAAVLDVDSANNLGTVSVTPTGELDFTRAELACGTETFQYVLCDYAACDTTSFTITITCPEDIFHTQGFSPDGDGLNDKLVFTGLEYFSPASIRIYNRYGSQVYESEEYQNDWDGTYKNAPLPDGTYFYVLQLASGKKYNDYLVINR